MFEINTFVLEFRIKYNLANVHNGHIQEGIFGSLWIMKTFYIVCHVTCGYSRKHNIIRNGCIPI